MTAFLCGVRPRVFPLLCAVALLVPDLSAARVTSGAIDVLHYDVEVKPDFDQRTITGMTTIRFRSLASTLTEVSFSPNAMTIHEARMNGTVLRIIRETDSIALELARPVRRGETARGHADLLGHTRTRAHVRGASRLFKLLRVRLDDLSPGRSR